MAGKHRVSAQKQGAGVGFECTGVPLFFQFPLQVLRRQISDNTDEVDHEGQCCVFLLLL